MHSGVTSNDLLQAVSRSFALCIPLLERNKIAEVENMYLLSRVADTIEDSALQVDEKKQLMQTFFETLASGNGIPSFVNNLRAGIIDDHDKILAVEPHYRMILDVFWSLDPAVRSVSTELLGEMASGMMKYQTADIQTFADLDEYCYYVAGTVGLYLNRLVALKDSILLDRAQAISVGRYLQKVNIIKNFHKDQQEGRVFWPSELFGTTAPEQFLAAGPDAMAALDVMIENAQQDAQTAFAYAASIPDSLPGYRKFVLVPVLMATENLRLMQGNPEVFTNPQGVKIPRMRMAEILALANEAAGSNDALAKTVELLL